MCGRCSFCQTVQHPQWRQDQPHQLEKSSAVKQKFLKLKIDELKKLEDTIYDKEYYIVVYSNNLSELEEDKRLLLSSFPLNLETISEEKKEKIFFKLNNLNSAL